MKNQVIAFIPARIGSRRLKHKNIILFNKKPLICWTVEAAIKSRIFDDIYISTDSSLIKNKLIKFKKDIKFLYRPKKFSGAKTKTSTLIKYLIKKNNFKNRYDHFVLLQPTSPLRTKYHINHAWNLYKKENLKCLFSVSEKKNKFPIQTKKKKIYKNNKLINKYKKRLYQNGAIYIKNINFFLKYPKFVNALSNVFIMNNNDSLDIDTQRDLEF